MELRDPRISEHSGLPAACPSRRMEPDQLGKKVLCVSGGCCAVDDITAPARHDSVALDVPALGSANDIGQSSRLIWKFQHGCNTCRCGFAAACLWRRNVASTGG